MNFMCGSVHSNDCKKVVYYTGHTNQDVIKHHVLDRKTINLIPNHILFKSRWNGISEHEQLWFIDFRNKNDDDAY